MKPEAIKGKVQAEKALLNKLTRLTKQVSLGNYTKARSLFELTITATHPKVIAELAESFGMMIVKVESREFKLEQLVEALENTCRNLTAAKKALESFNQTLGKKVKEQTEQWHHKNSELTHTLQMLKTEIKERRQAEKKSRQLYDQLEEANRKLMDAYLWMRQKKDRLAARQYTESIVFLVEDDGRICGVTENAVELTKKKRSDLDNCHIQDVLTTVKGQTFEAILRQARPKLSYLTNLQLKDQPDNQTLYEAKLTRVALDGKRLITIVLHEPVEK